MTQTQRDTPDATYVDTPRGLFTAGGRWFRTTEASLASYAGPVLVRVPLPQLLREAERWLQTPETFTLWLLPVLLLVLAPLPASLAALAFYVVWKVVGPAAVSRTALPVVRLLDRVGLQALYFTAALTALAWLGSYGAVWAGVGGFVLLRWGLVARLAAPFVDRLWAWTYDLPVPDQVLRALVIRVAMAHRLSLPHLDRIERQILENLRAR